MSPANADSPDLELTWPHLLTTLLNRQDLAPADTAWVMDRVMNGEATAAQLAGFAVALRAKGETPDEVRGLADSMLEHAVPVRVPGRLVDIVGTGGDRANTVNISTMAAVVAAASGATVVKHGNRAASSKCGAADLLEGLGVPISLGPDGVAATTAEVGIGFCFAPIYHPSFRHAAAPRREMGIPTVFNILGPLTNPARPAATAVGCGIAAMAPVLAGVFAHRGTDALVFRGDDGLDELTTTTTSAVWRVHAGQITRMTIDPEELGLAPSDPADLRGGDVAFNVAIALAVFEGRSGAVRDAVVLNAGAAIAAHAGLGGDLLVELTDGMARAREAIDSGAVAGLLQNWVKVGTRLTG